MPVTTADFEELLHCRIANLSELGWSAPLVQANFGGGYGAGIIANQDYGLHKWTIKSDFLPDNDSLIVGTDDQPFFTYFFEFVKRHILLGNKPFIISESRTNRYYLVRFITDGNFNFGRTTSKFYTFEGVPVEEARHEDLSFHEDGSLVMPDTTPPSIPTGFAMTPGSGSMDFDWTESTDDDSGVDLYEIEITLAT